MSTAFEIEQIRAEDTHDLRRRVLRDGDPKAVVEWAGDDAVTTTHLGAVDPDGAIIGISTWILTPDPELPGAIGAQLRGMATDSQTMGFGVGRAILDAGIERHRELGFDLIWAEARVSALGFYERAGFVAVSNVFDTAATGLPHRRVRFELR